MPVMDQCYYCQKYFPSDKIYAHEQSCDSNPNK